MSKWVNANTGRLGGDNGNVTLFGESADAHAACMLVTSPLAKGLFHKAIGRSRAFWDGKNGPMEGFEESRTRGIAFAKMMGQTSISGLRAMSADQLNALHLGISRWILW